MIPNIFICSTISDLRYLRDAARDAVHELAYNPIMSDYGDIGYISSTTAAESCYRSVSQCQLAVLIIGKRYGDVGKDGRSITHREFLTAKEHRIPTIAFVESQVMNYKEVYDTDPKAPSWDSFTGMDHPHQTFALIDEVRNSEFYNGLLPITTAGDLKRLLKLQIADFVGDKLNDVVRPIKTEVQDILAELKTLRKEMTPDSETSAKSEKYLRTMRFLLDDRRANFRSFCKALARDVDAAVPLLIEQPALDEFVSSLGYKIVIEDNKENFDKMMRAVRDPNTGSYRLLSATHSVAGWWAVFDNNTVVFSSNQLQEFRATYKALQANL